MGNPAVFELVKTKIASQPMCIEDNIGEAIHLHIGSIRLDMTVDEFCDLTKKLTECFNIIVPCEGFNINDFDPFFIFRIAGNLPHLKNIRKKTETLKNLLINLENDDGVMSVVRIDESPLYKFLSGQINVLQQYENETYIFEDLKTRLDFIKKQMDTGNLANVIIINSRGYILDGYKRACFNYLKEQDRVVDVVIFEFDEEYIPNCTRKLKRVSW